MGRIKSLLVKKTTRALMKEDNKFSEDFEKNKPLLESATPSKSTRNKIK